MYVKLTHLCKVQKGGYRSKEPGNGNHSLLAYWYKWPPGRKFWGLGRTHWHLRKGLPWVQNLDGIGRFDRYHIGHCWYNRNPIRNPYALLRVRNPCVRLHGTREDIRMCSPEPGWRKGLRGRNHWEIGWYIRQCLQIWRSVIIVVAQCGNFMIFLSLRFYVKSKFNFWASTFSKLDFT